MVVVDHGPDSPEGWRELVRDSPSSWFWLDPRWIAYSAEFAGIDHGDIHVLTAHATASSSAILGGMFVQVEQRPSRAPGACCTLGGGGGPMWAPAVRPDIDADAHREVMSALLGWVAQLATEARAVTGTVRSTPLAPSPVFAAAVLATVGSRQRWALRQGVSQVVDLSRSAASLLQGMTKGHRAAVRRGERLLEVVVATDATADPDIFLAFRAMHIAAAGRVTRPDATWDLMGRWVEEGIGILLGARHGGSWVGFSYVLAFGTGAYYASAANDRSRSDLPIGQALQAAAFDHLARAGVDRYELGGQVYGPTPAEVPSPKELAIARFKRGFGGDPVMVQELERWWDPSTARSALTARAQAFADALQEDEAGETG